MNSDLARLTPEQELHLLYDVTTREVLTRLLDEIDCQLDDGEPVILVDHLIADDADDWEDEAGRILERGLIFVRGLDPANVNDAALLRDVWTKAVTAREGRAASALDSAELQHFVALTACYELFAKFVEGTSEVYQ